MSSALLIKKFDVSGGPQSRHRSRASSPRHQQPKLSKIKTASRNSKRTHQRKETSQSSSRILPGLDHDQANVRDLAVSHDNNDPHLDNRQDRVTVNDSSHDTQDQIGCRPGHDHLDLPALVSNQVHAELQGELLDLVLGQVPYTASIVYTLFLLPHTGPKATVTLLSRGPSPPTVPNVPHPHCAQGPLPTMNLCFRCLPMINETHSDRYYLFIHTVCFAAERSF